MKFLLDKNYNTFSESFEISEIENNNSALGWYTFISILLCFSIGIGFNAITIIIGNNNANAICFKQSHIISLSDYAIMCGIVGAICNSTVIVATIIIALGIYTYSPATLLATIPVIICIIFYSIFSFVMAILGTIELAYSFPLCKDEAYSLCVIVIILVVLQYLGCCSSVSLKKSK